VEKELEEEGVRGGGGGRGGERERWKKRGNGAGKESRA